MPCFITSDTKSHDPLSIRLANTTALCGHPLTKDGAAKLFSWQAGLDATTGPTGRASIYRMKAAADETRMDSAIDIMSKLIRDLDSTLFFSGRNTLIAKDLKKKIQALKPRV